MKPLKSTSELSISDCLRLDLCMRLVGLLVKLAPSRTNEGALLIQHLQSFCGHAVKGTDVNALDWDRAKQ